MKLSIVIPVYNEGKNIQKTIKNLEEKVKISHEILLIYDFQEDNTLIPARQIQKQLLNLKLIKNKYGRGVLNALKTGFEKAKAEAICVTMADLSDDPHTINKMYEKIEQGYHIVCGSRYIKGGSQKSQMKLKSFLSRTAGLTSHFFIGLPVHDLTNAFKMYKKSIFDKITIESTGGFEVSSEILFKAYFAGFKICEVPTRWQDRTYGKSRFKMAKWLPFYLKWYFWALKKRWL